VNNMVRRRKREAVHQEKPVEFISTPEPKMDSPQCIFCGQLGETNNLRFVVHDGKLMHSDCLWQAYCQLKQEKDEKENPQNYRLGY